MYFVLPINCITWHWLHQLYCHQTITYSLPRTETAQVTRYFSAFPQKVNRGRIYHFEVVSNVSWWYETVNWNLAACLLTLCSRFHTEVIVKLYLTVMLHVVDSRRMDLDVKSLKMKNRKWCANKWYLKILQAQPTNFRNACQILTTPGKFCVFKSNSAWSPFHGLSCQFRSSGKSSHFL